MDTDCVQHGAHVYGSVFGLSRWTPWSQAGSAVYRADLYCSFDLATVFTKSGSDARASGDRRDFIRDLLSADDDVCAAQSSAALHDLRYRRLLNGHLACDVAFGTVGSFVHRAPVVALDLLDWRSEIGRASCRE